MISLFRSVRRLAMNKMDLTRRGFLQTTNLLAVRTMSLDEAAPLFFYFQEPHLNERIEVHLIQQDAHGP
jgi:hypothetical protein